MTDSPVPKVVGLVTHPSRGDASRLADRLEARLRAAGIEVRRWRDGDDLASFVDGLDLAISLGGDGTMLRTVDLVHRSDAAVLGVNVGHLGYLTEVEPDQLDRAIERILAGEFTVTERMVLQVVVRSGGAAGGRWWALNEAVVEKLKPGRIVRLAVDINGIFFTTYAADGLIVATPTGSTAYSFSARGPIVSPRHRCLLLTPVSPHMLFDRSLVLDADEELHFVVMQPQRAALTIDGLEVGELDCGDTVSCTAGPRPARVVTFGERNFHQILKAKFGLADR